MEKRYMELSCPHCREQLNVRKEYRGRTGKCNHCGQRFKVPESPESESFTGNPGIVSGIVIDNIAPESTPRPYTPASFLPQGNGKRAALFGLFMVLLLAAVTSAWYLPSNIEREPLVYLTKEDRYYFYDLCPRALSLGLTEESPTYRESVAIEKGHKPVPPELRDTDVQAERAERARLQLEAQSAQAELDRVQQEEYALQQAEWAAEQKRQQAAWLQEQERQRQLAAWYEDQERQRIAQELHYIEQGLLEIAELAEANAREALLQDLKRYTREVVLRRVDDPAKTVFHGYRWKQGPSEHSYTVQWIVKPSRAWQLEVVDAGEYWRLVYCDEVRGLAVWR